MEGDRVDSRASGGGGGGRGGRGARRSAGGRGDRQRPDASSPSSSSSSSSSTSAVFWFAFGGLTVVGLFFCFGLLAHGQLGSEGDYSPQLFIKNQLRTLPEIPVAVKRIEEAIVNSTLVGLERSRRDLEGVAVYSAKAIESLRSGNGNSALGQASFTTTTTTAGAVQGKAQSGGSSLRGASGEKSPAKGNGASPAVIARPATVPKLVPPVDAPKPAAPVAAAGGGGSGTGPVKAKPKPKPSSDDKGKTNGKGATQTKDPIVLHNAAPKVAAGAAEGVPKARWGPPKAVTGETYEPLDCPFSENVAYWHRSSDADNAYRSPFDEPLRRTGRNAGSQLREKYITFEPDVGGWNNIRMQMELVLVFAAVTGRTLVIPPEQAMYLLDKGKGHENAHSFEDYFPFEKIRSRIKVISMAEFLQREGVSGHLRAFNDSGLVLYPPNNKAEVDATKRQEKRAMWAYLRRVAYCPKWEPFKDFLVFPPRPGVNASTLPNGSVYDAKRTAFGGTRTPIFYDDFLHEVPVIHFISLPEEGYRLLIHFYNFIHFQDAFMDRFYKRFIRDYVHYVGEIFCRGAFIVQDLLRRSGGSYAAFHIRRGELQYKEVKLPADKILENLGDSRLPPSLQVAYVATDERNKTFFDAFKKRFKTVLFLDDYFESAGLGSMNPNFLGMVDQVACTNGAVFVGTWFSTFTAYITRLRGYLGYPDNTVFFGDKARRDRYQTPETPKFPYYMREWNEAWIDIDEK